jgi:hypothetical protein
MALLVCHFCLPSSAEQQKLNRVVLQPTVIAKLAFKSTVLVVSDDGTMGSGFVVGPALVATNHHVIKSAKDIIIRIIGDETIYKVAEVNAQDTDNDLAILLCPSLKAAPLMIGDSTKMEIGETVYAVGNPEGFEGTMSNGILSGIRMFEGRRQLQMTAPISHGSSGGPLFNQEGSVIGINTAFLADAQNINFAVPIEPLKLLMKTSQTCSTNNNRQNEFHGYYCPQKLVSPMSDDATYVPAGDGTIARPAGQDDENNFAGDIELAANLNDRVYCLLDGIVSRVGYRSDKEGVSVEIIHPYPGVKTLYTHLNAYSVLPGAYVERGRVIGYVGSTGKCNGNVLGFAVIKTDSKEYIRPLDFLSLTPRYVGELRAARVNLKTKQDK